MIKTPYFELLYNDKDATHDIAKHMISATYTDTLKGESDELSITLEDSERKWMGTWYPKQGAKLMFKIGFLGESTLDCGQFEIDEIEINDTPNTVRIRALSAGVNSPLRTVNYRAFDDKTLDVIIKEVAQSLGYSVEGKIEPLKIERITQKESDLAFIKRLAEQYGYIVKVKGTRLIFSRLDKLKINNGAIMLQREQIHNGWRFREQIRTTKKSATISRQNPKTKKLVTSQAKGTGKVSVDKSITRGNATTSTAAKAKAKANLTKDNDPQASGSLIADGDTKLIAGANFDLQGFERFDGKCLINKATHAISRSGGYTTAIDFIRIE